MTTTAIRQDENSFWLRSRGWDLTFITGSVVLMALPYASYFAGQALGFSPDTARNIVNGIIAFLIGGPHMYATHLRSTLDPAFRERHRSIYLAALIIPAGVIYLGYYHFLFLLTFFFFWASIHVLHQIIYIVDCYNGRVRAPQSLSSKLADYGVVLTSLYPVAMYRFVHNTFTVGQNTLYFPDALKVDATWYLASAAFAGALAFFLIKTYREFRAGEGNVPKTLLILITAVATFVTPFFSELDVAFQGLNSWHSFQYLGLTWYVNRLRYDRGDIPRKISLFSAPGEWWKFYGFNIGLNLVGLTLIASLLFTRSITGLSFDQCYYMVVLCFLLTHYYHDHLLFTEYTDFSTSAISAAGAGAGSRG